MCWIHVRARLPSDRPFLAKEIDSVSVQTRMILWTVLQHSVSCNNNFYEKEYQCGLLVIEGHVRGPNKTSHLP